MSGPGQPNLLNEMHITARASAGIDCLSGKPRPVGAVYGRQLMYSTSVLIESCRTSVQKCTNYRIDEFWMSERSHVAALGKGVE